MWNFSRTKYCNIISRFIHLIIIGSLIVHNSHVQINFMSTYCYVTNSAKNSIPLGFFTVIWRFASTHRIRDNIAYYYLSCKRIHSWVGDRSCPFFDVCCKWNLTYKNVQSFFIRRNLYMKLTYDLIQIPYWIPFQRFEARVIFLSNFTLFAIRYNRLFHETHWVCVRYRDVRRNSNIFVQKQIINVKISVIWKETIYYEVYRINDPSVHTHCNKT